MKNHPIKIKLSVRKNEVSYSYRIESLTGAIVIGSADGKTLRAGDFLDEKMAERLNMSYQVTVTPKPAI
jgi:predicted RNA-binding protein Jag